MLHLFIFALVACVVALCLRITMQQPPQHQQTSPIIKPVDYRNEDLLLRKSLAAVNWSLVTNKARFLYYLKKPKRISASTSFTFGSHYR